MDPAYFLGGVAPLTNNVTDAWCKQILKATNEEESLWPRNYIIWNTEQALQTIKQREIREMVSIKLVKEIEEDVFRLATSLRQRKNSESPWRKDIFLHFFTMLKIFSLAHARDKTKNIFLLFTR